MKTDTGQINLVLAWLWIVLGLVSGFVMGLSFHREDWLGGYASFKRRLYRLAHISFFGLGAVNLMFYFTAQQFAATGALTSVASWGFVVGAVSMPICCFIMAHNAKARALFLIPVLSLIVGGVLMLVSVMRSATFANFEFQTAKSSGGLFPLTPALSPRERENHRQSIGESGAVGNCASRVTLFLAHEPRLGALASRRRVVWQHVEKPAGETPTLPGISKINPDRTPL